MAKYMVTVTDAAFYEVDADSQTEARNIAEDYFRERIPCVKIEEVTPCLRDLLNAIAKFNQ